MVSELASKSGSRAFESSADSCTIPYHKWHDLFQTHLLRIVDQDSKMNTAIAE